MHTSQNNTEKGMKLPWWEAGGALQKQVQKISNRRLPISSLGGIGMRIVTDSGWQDGTA